MQKMPLSLSSCLLIAASGCGSDEIPFTPAAQAGTPLGSGVFATTVAAPAPQDAAAIVARGAFATDADRERFETEVLPSARAFLAYWADAGLTVPHPPTRLFISPPPG